VITALSLDDNTGTPVSLFTSDEKFLPTQLDGLFGVESPRQVKRPRPTNHGAVNDTRYGDGKLISLAFEVIGSDGGDSMTQFRAFTAAAVQTWDYGAALLKWTELTSGLTLQRLVKLDSDINPVVDANTGKLLAFQAQFFAEDPRAYSQTLQTITSTALSASGGGHVFPATYPRTYTSSGGGTVAFTNAGNRKTPPVFKVYGGCTNPQIVNVTTGERLTITGTIANGDYLEIGTSSSGQRYAKLNGTTSRNNFIDSLNSVWFELPKGTTNLQMIAGTFDGSAKMDVLARSAYA
jgi:hypothetical protein